MAEFEATNFNDGRQIMDPHSAGEVMCWEDSVSLPATLALNDIFKLGYLPAGCVPVDFLGYTEELDEHETDTLRITIGVLNDAGDGIVSGAEFVTALQCEVDKVFRGNAAGMFGLAVNRTTNRVIAGKVTAAGATKAAGVLKGKLLYKAA